MIPEDKIPSIKDFLPKPNKDKDKESWAVWFEDLNKIRHRKITILWGEAFLRAEIFYTSTYSPDSLYDFIESQITGANNVVLQNITYVYQGIIEQLHPLPNAFLRGTARGCVGTFITKQTTEENFIKIILDRAKEIIK